MTIIFVVPPYVGYSNGVKSLHKIAHSINQVGGDARLVFHNGRIGCGGPPEWTNPAWNTPCLAEEDKHLLLTVPVVYPEIITGNPCCANKIIRYLGNKDGLLTGKKMGARDGDFLLAHSRMIEPNANCVLFNAEINPHFYDYGTTNREMNVTYIGKGYLYGKCDIVEDSMMIGRDWPRGQDQLAYLLRRTRIFYTWDSWTATNVEAIVCGAVPFYLRYEPWTEAEIDGSELGPIPHMDARTGKFDAKSFQEGRRRLIENIERLNATWDERVNGFVDQVTAYFGETS